ncbi:MAG: hypothetical protein JWN24_377 [Phycisphaerales bacterium]|nr:hypothetical protein [Phycisphaerales bacterium]
MKTRSFDAKDASRIRTLLAEKIRAKPDDKKSIRQQIRSIGFRISSYRLSGPEFSPADFDRLVKSGEITIG